MTEQTDDDQLWIERMMEGMVQTKGPTWEAIETNSTESAMAYRDFGPSLTSPSQR